MTSPLTISHRDPRLPLTPYAWTAAISSEVPKSPTPDPNKDSPCSPSYIPPGSCCRYERCDCPPLVLPSPAPSIAMPHLEHATPYRRCPGPIRPARPNPRVKGRIPVVNLVTPDNGPIRVHSTPEGPCPKEPRTVFAFMAQTQKDDSCHSSDSESSHSSTKPQQRQLSSNVSIERVNNQVVVKQLDSGTELQITLPPKASELITILLNKK